MKEITAILILLTLLTSCGGQRKTAENPALGTTAENNTGEISCEVTTTCLDMISPITTTAEIPEISPKTTESQTTVTVSENAENKRSDDSVITAEITEISPKATESQTPVTVSENAKEKKSEDSEETAEPAQTTAKIPETQPKTESQETVTVSENAEEKEPVDSVTTAVQTETKVTEIPDIPRKTDYEKALEIYNFVRENVSGTCINYACQTIPSSTFSTSPAKNSQFVKPFRAAFSFAASTASSTISTPMTFFATGASIWAIVPVPLYKS